MSKSPRTFVSVTIPTGTKGRGANSSLNEFLMHISLRTSRLDFV